MTVKCKCDPYLGKGSVDFDNFPLCFCCINLPSIYRKKNKVWCASDMLLFFF